MKKNGYGSHDTYSVQKKAPPPARRVPPQNLKSTSDRVAKPIICRPPILSGIWVLLLPHRDISRVADPVWYWPDTDLDPASQDNADPDPDPSSQDKPDPDPDTSVLKFSDYFMMIFNKKLLPFKFFDGP